MILEHGAGTEQTQVRHPLLAKLFFLSYMPSSQKPRNKHRKQTRKHETTVTFDVVANESGQIEVHFTPEGWISSPQALPGSYKTKTEYDRPTGKTKIVFAHGTNFDGAFLDERRVFRQFDKIVALDTNNIDIDGRRVSTTCLLISASSLDEDTVRFDKHGFAIIDVPQEVNPEFVALDIALHFYLPQQPDEGATKIAVLTDSALGDHDAINKRMLPYLGSKLLRDDLKLVYASAETGIGFARDLMKICNSQADELKKDCIKSPEILVTVDNGYPFCKGWTKFEFKGD